MYTAEITKPKIDGGFPYVVGQKVRVRDLAADNPHHPEPNLFLQKTGTISGLTLASTLWDCQVTLSNGHTILFKFSELELMEG